MTRNFSNEGHNNRRPSPRHASSGQFREDSSSRPPRVRLSRDAVDRAWENGASRNHADYHPRQNAARPPFQRQGRPSPEFERPQQPRGYENRRQGYGAPSSSFNREDNYRNRDTGYRPQREQRPEMGPRRFPESGQRAPGSQPGLNSERWNRDAAPQRPGYRDHYQDQRPSPSRFEQDGPRTPSRPGYRNENGPRPYDRSRSPRPFEHDNQERGNFSRGPRPYERPNQERSNFSGSPRPYDRSNQDRGNFSRGPRPFERDNQERGTFSRGPRPFGGNDRERGNSSHDRRMSGPRRDNNNPRWQSRPTAQRDYAESQRDSQGFRREYSDGPGARPPFGQERAYDGPGRAQFEGDYEGLETSEQVERPVTRLPDGRVLKGPRPVQRKDARFWNGVEGETSSLLPKPFANAQQGELAAPLSAEQEPTELPTTPRPPTARPARARKQPAGEAPKPKTVRTTRAASAGPRAAREKVAKRKKGRAPEGPVTRPSRKGYKWPTSEG